ncbi:MAG: succinylglutamate desuccinylase [Bdellovibrionaceae bacterium]|jgi:succinylglutamate desuccinylase|nr:succinylglutamate desuccinylase [Pseudobdellovibrionaceae bacterium]
MLKVHEGISEQILKAQAHELHEYISNFSVHYIPTVEKRKPIVLSVLLHGNECTGLTVLQQLLTNPTVVLRRPLYVIFGNVEAAKSKVRHLAHQPDFNRIWMGGGRPEHKQAKEILDYFNDIEIFATIDIHNNTGKSPDYACVNHLDETYLRLAQLFSPTTIYFTRPFEVLSNAFSNACPAITLECGLSNSESGIERSLKLIQYCMNIDLLPTNVSVENEIFHSFARINIPPECSIGFGSTEEHCDFVFPEALEDNNFIMYHKGEYFCSRKSEAAILVATNEKNIDITSEYFEYRGLDIYINKDFTPSMFTRNKAVIYQDCLGYIMRTCDRESIKKNLKNEK